MNFFKRSSSFTLFTRVVSAIIGALIIRHLINRNASKPASYLRLNDSRKYIKPALWKGTPLDMKGRFMNHEYPFYQDYLKILIWLPSHLINLFRNRNRSFPVISHTSVKY